jgi:hypothetical protein
MKPRTSSVRLQYLDWVRGLGSIVMLQGHAFDSFLKPELHTGGAFIFSQFLGGMPPAIFLFLTGVTLAFLMDSSERKGLSPLERVFTAFRRSGYLFALAFAFRLQMWLFGFPAPWTDLFKVDILNAMGFAIAVFSVMALFRTMERVRLCAALGLAIAMAAPLVSQLNLAHVPWLLRIYIVPDLQRFALFPWGAYLAFGMSAGSLIRVIPHDALERAMQWGALLGGALILSSQYVAGLPYSIYSKSDYWLNSPAQILTKTGVLLLLMAVAFVWTRYGATDGWSWVRQFGTTSLIVYWVHIELVYGRWFWFLKNSLTVIETAIAAALLIAVMLGISVVRTNWDKVKIALGEMGWGYGPKPGGAEGD